MHDDKVNKIFNLLVGSGNLNEVSNARESLVDLLAKETVNGRDYYLACKQDDTIERLQRENDQLARKADNCARELQQVHALIEAMLIGAINDTQVTKTPKSKNEGRTKAWILEVADQDFGVSKEKLFDLEPSLRSDISRRWSEIQNEGLGFLIKYNNEDRLVKATPANREKFKKEFNRNEKRREKRREARF